MLRARFEAGSWADEVGAEAAAAVVGVDEGAMEVKCRGEIWRSTEGGRVVAGAATAVDMAVVVE